MDIVKYTLRFHPLPLTALFAHLHDSEVNWCSSMLCASFWLGMLLLDTVTKTWMHSLLLVLANKTLTGGNLLHTVKYQYQEPLTWKNSVSWFWCGNKLTPEANEKSDANLWKMRELYPPKHHTAMQFLSALWFFVSFFGVLGLYKKINKSKASKALHIILLD